MKIESAKQLKTLKGEVYKTSEGTDLTLGGVIAESLATSDIAGKMKSYVLAHKFYNDKEVEVDAADLAIIKKSVEACKSYNNLILGQVLVELEA